MEINESLIERNTDWLLNNASAPVKYLVKRDLGEDPGSSYMAGLRGEVCRHKAVVEIFSRQREDGSWFSGGSWAQKPSYYQKTKTDGYDPGSPPYVTTVWVLSVLGDMGFTFEDERIRRGCEYVFNYRHKNNTELYGIFNDDSYEADPYWFGVCSLSRYLLGLGKVAPLSDRRLERGYRRLLSAQREDGGWVLEFHLQERNWTRSCPASTSNAVQALSAANCPRFEPAVRKGLEFLMRHLSTKESEEIEKFYYRGHSTVHELLMLSQYGIGVNERPFHVLINWLMSMYRIEEACFRYAGKPVSRYRRRSDGMDSRVAKYRLFHLIEDDWLTYYGTRICANLLRL